MMKKTLFVVLFIALLFGSSFAQEKERKLQKMPLFVSVMNKNISIPIVSPLKYKFSPAIIIGTEYTLDKNEKRDFHLFGNIGYYYQRYWESTPFLEFGAGYRYYANRFSFYPRIGVGYAHIFSTTPVYKFDNGEFKSLKNRGNSVFQSSFSMNIGYQIKKKDMAPRIYATYIFSIQIPYSSYVGFHQFIGLGYQFYPFKKK